MSHMIELHRVSKFYTNKDTVSTGFSRVDLNLDIGEFVVITGESGSGKSTLLNVISGLDSYEEGEMFVAGEDTSGYRTIDYERYRKQYIGNIFQDFNLVNSYTVYQNIELCMLLAGKPKEERKRRIPELIELVGLTKYTKTKASRLSGGQKQRVAIARALAKDAPIIVADEPTGNLDSESAAKVMNTLHQIAKDKLVVIVTHNYEQAEPYVTRKLTMHDGHLMEDKVICETEILPYQTVMPGAVQAKAPVREADAEAPGTETAGEYALQDALETVGGSDAVRPAGRAARNAAEPGTAQKGRAARPDDRRAGKRNALRRTPDSITPGSELRLGIRNTFNLPTKFILLLFVYLFVTMTVLGQYASTKESIHENALMGYNPYFTDMNANRLIVKKTDGKAFTDADYDRIQKTDNVDYIVKTDAGIDSGIMFESENIDISGPMFPVSAFDEKKLTWGRMPKKDNEVVIAMDETSTPYEQVKDTGEDYLGRKYYVQASNSMTMQGGMHLLDHKLKIVGIAMLKSSRQMNYNTHIYVTDKVANDILIKNAASNSKLTLNYNGKKADVAGTETILASKNVSEGHAYISEDQAYTYFNDGAARNKPLTIKARNPYFTSKCKLTISQVFKDTTSEYLLGIKKADYENYTSQIFINPKDYNKLFDKGNFQSSVYMKDEKLSADTQKALEAQGLNVLVVKDTLSDTTGGQELIIKMLNYGQLIIEFVVLFFIAYAVIRLIMRSRNSYYSTLRILGASRRNTDHILCIELVTMMLIAYGAVMAFATLVKRGILTIRPVIERLAFLHTMDYLLLFIGLLVMSLLIGNRYSRKIFGKSAMKAYREEV